LFSVFSTIIRFYRIQKKGLCDDTFFKPFSWALPSVRSAFGAPKASKMSRRLLQFQNRHNFSLQHVLPFFSKVSLATFLADQLKSVQADTELLLRACTSKCLKNQSLTQWLSRLASEKNLIKFCEGGEPKTKPKNSSSFCKEKLGKRERLAL
jgi:hypothetical protein